MIRHQVIIYLSSEKSSTIYAHKDDGFKVRRSSLFTLHYFFVCQNRHNLKGVIIYIFYMCPSPTKSRRLLVPQMVRVLCVAIW